MKILFIHGLASSGRYKMANSLRILLRPVEVIAPDVPIEPGEALGLLQAVCREACPDLVVGLSLGGFWAQKLRGWRKLLVNPDFHPSRLLGTMMGENKYLSPRGDGAATFSVTAETVKGYEAMEELEFEGLDDEERLLSTGMFACGDEVVRCGEEFGLHYPGRGRSYPGGHLPDYPQLKAYFVPVIREIMAEAGLQCPCGRPMGDGRP